MSNYVPMIINLFNYIYPYTNLNTSQIYYCSNKKDGFFSNSTDRKMEIDASVLIIHL